MLAYSWVNRIIGKVDDRIKSGRDESRIRAFSFTFEIDLKKKSFDRNASPRWLSLSEEGYCRVELFLPRRDLRESTAKRKKTRNIFHLFVHMLVHYGCINAFMI